MAQPDPAPMRIRLSEERTDQLIEVMQAFARDALDLDMSEFQTRRWLAFLVLELGAPIYNQAIQDARGFLQTKLEDLEGEFYEPEPQ
jgi:uncharacterized protein (DUF2164 family)